MFYFRKVLLWTYLFSSTGISQGYPIHFGPVSRSLQPFFRPWKTFFFSVSRFFLFPFLRWRKTGTCISSNFPSITAITTQVPSCANQPWCWNCEEVVWNFPNSLLARLVPSANREAATWLWNTTLAPDALPVTASTWMGTCGMNPEKPLKENKIKWFR